MKTFPVLTILILAGISHSLMSQGNVPFLERTITVSFNEEPLESALKKIAQQGGFTFSYNPSVLEGGKTINYTFTNKTVREILDQIFQGTIEYKARNNYIILTKGKEHIKKKDEQILTGYVIDEATGERLRNVSVYDPVTLSSATTDSYGYFEIKIDKPSADVILSVNKQNYSDTTIAVSSSSKRLLNIPIHVNKKKLVSVADSVSQKFKRLWKKILIPSRANVLNIEDTLYRTFQFSVVPFVGTNHKLSGSVINDYSVNLFGGYSRGVRKMELGGYFNIVRNNVDGAQLAGMFNVVGGKVKGFQAAGIFNANYDSVQGGQLAGIANLNWTSMGKFSAAGILNFTRLQSSGVHLAGIGNVTVGEQRGAHLAGLFNFSTKSSEYLQMAGLYNFAAGNVKGAQIAGLINFSGRKMTGTQVSGLINYATTVKGGQIGFLNVADSIEQGIPIGFLSFVMKGYHKIELSADEIFYANIAFRTGVRKFYNIFTAGAKPNTFKNDYTFWTFGYGVGTAPKLSRNIFLNIDITSSQIVDHQKIEAINSLNKLYLGFDIQASKHFSIAFGATLNGYVTDSTYEGYRSLFSDYQPHLLYNKTYSNDVNFKMWLGGKIGIRFL